MPYIGNQPAEQFTSFATQTFSVSATTSYTLDHAVTNENEIALFVNNVRQQPGSGKAYTATGTALTLSAATASTDTMYCVFLGRALQTVTPATNSITAAMVGNDLISGKDALTSSPDDTDELLISDAGTLKRIDVSLVGGKNTPSFKATMSADQDSLSSEANTKVAFNTESWDVTGVYDHSTNYRFTPAVVGKYLISAHIHFRASGDFSGKAVRIYKNGSFLTESQDALDEDRHHSSRTNNATITTIVSLDADDYIEVYGKVFGASHSIKAEGSYFTGFKLIGV